VKLVEVARNFSEGLDPTWRKWIDLVELAVAEAQQPAWSGCVHVREQRPADAPLLHGATLRVSAPRATEFAARLAEALGIVALETVEPLALIRMASTETAAKRRTRPLKLAVSVI
jgi:hypothetical protein